MKTRKIKEIKDVADIVFRKVNGRTAAFVVKETFVGWMDDLQEMPGGAKVCGGVHVLPVVRHDPAGRARVQTGAGEIP